MVTAPRSPSVMSYRFVGSSRAPSSATSSTMLVTVAPSVGSAPRLGADVRVATDHDGVVPGCPNEGTTIADMVLDVADDGTLEDPTER